MARQKYTTGPGWRIEWRKFTKADALAALGKSSGLDRNTDESWVAALAQTMDLGLWDVYSPSQVPVAFDRDGVRLNGKHRLSAFLKSKLTEIVFPVIEGLSPEAFASFDQNVKARMHRAAHRDRSNVGRDEARINWLEALISGNPKVKVTTQVFAHLADHKWRKQLEWADETLPKAGKQGKAPYAAALMYAHRVDANLADKVGKAWANGGAGLPKPLLRLRDTALSATNFSGARNDRLKHSFKMLNALALMHQGHPVPDRLSDNLNGLRYFSARLRDGAATRWEKQTILGGEEG